MQDLSKRTASGGEVRRSLLSERDWEKLTKVNTQLRLKRNKVRFTPYWLSDISGSFAEILLDM